MIGDSDCRFLWGFISEIGRDVAGVETSTQREVAMSVPTFMDLCLSGHASADGVADAVEAWHEGQDPRTLREALGLSHDEFALWLAAPSSLPAIIARRAKGETA